MRIHTLIHAPFEKTGIIENWAIEKKYHFSSTHTYQGEKLPNVSEIDFLIVMGGPQDMTALHKYPYLQEEVTFTKQAIYQQKAVLGICLGAQIIAESLGAKTERSPNKEIGVFPICVTNEGEKDPVFKLFPKQFDVMHWHNDMPGISKNAVLLAHSEGCPRQAIRYDDRVYGFQFHMETTPALIKSMAEHCAHELQPARYIQTATEMLAADFSEINQKMHLVLDYLVSIMHE